MTYNLNKAFWIITNFADETGYFVEEISKTHVQLHLQKFHGVDFELVANSADYIQVKQWDENREEYNRSVYSIRCVSDVISFCNILEASVKIRAKRQDE